MLEVTKRQYIIGGSDMGDLFSLSTYGCRYRLYKRYTGEWATPDNPKFRRGRELEELIHRKAKKLHPDWKFYRRREEYRHSTLPLIAHVDSLAKKSDGSKVIVEYKTIESNFLKLPEVYILQVQLYMHLSGRKEAHIFTLSMQEWELKEYIVEYDPEIGELIETETEKFLEEIHTGVVDKLPPWDERCQSCPFFQECHKDLTLDENFYTLTEEEKEILKAIEVIKEAEETKKELEKISKEAKEKIKAFMQENKINNIILPDFSFYISLTKSTRKQFNSKKFKEENPSLYEQYVEEKEIFRLDAKKPSKKLLKELEGKLKQLKEVSDA